MPAETVTGFDDRRLNPVSALWRTAAVVAAGVLVVVGAATIGATVAGITGSLVAAVAGEIAVAAFATIRAYPGPERPPILTFVVGALLFTIVLPLAYLAWRWSSREAGSDG